MTTASVNGAELYYEIHGEGQPLVLIMGLGGNLDWWGTGFIKHLTTTHQVIAFDNRGAGRTVAPDGDFAIDMMADDVVGLLDVLGVAEADVFGISMGGMIAQEVALRHPSRVRKLILGCTTPGGSQQVFPTPLAMQLLLAEPTDAQAAMANQARLLFPDDFIEKYHTLLEENNRVLMRHPMTRDNFLRQFSAIQRWAGTYDRLATLTIPTLVMHGTEDILLPIGNSHLLRDQISGSEYIEYEGCGHGFTVQNAPQVLSDVETFLTS